MLPPIKDVPGLAPPTEDNLSVMDKMACFAVPAFHLHFFVGRGKVVASAQEKESIVYDEVDLAAVDEVRRNIPISKQKQLNAYTPAKPNSS